MGILRKQNLDQFVVFQSLPSEIEVKYKIAECYTILKLDKDAIAVLEGIPSRQRTPKVKPHSCWFPLKYESYFSRLVLK